MQAAASRSYRIAVTAGRRRHGPAVFPPLVPAPPLHPQKAAPAIETHQLEGVLGLSGPEVQGLLSSLPSLAREKASRAWRVPFWLHPHSALGPQPACPTLALQSAAGRHLVALFFLLGVQLSPRHAGSPTAAQAAVLVTQAHAHLGLPPRPALLRCSPACWRSAGSS